jgi:hypothetical protein
MTRDKGNFISRYIMQRPKQITKGIIAAACLILSSNGYARDLEYGGREISVYVRPGEPTQVQFPSTISGGFKKKQSSLNLDRKGTDLVIFGQDSLTEGGEAIIVRLDNGKSYSIRVHRASPEKPRDDMVRVEDSLTSGISSGDDDDKQQPSEEKKFDYAPPNQVSGLMREMVLNAEFGKTGITGYRVSQIHKGETVLSDGTIVAKIDRIFIGSNLWGYVVDAENLLQTSQKMNAGSFRIDGTLAISAKDWELSAQPLNVEQQAAAKHKTKLYIITRSKR